MAAKGHTLAEFLDPYEQVGLAPHVGDRALLELTRHVPAHTRHVQATPKLLRSAQLYETLQGRSAPGALP